MTESSGLDSAFSDYNSRVEKKKQDQIKLREALKRQDKETTDWIKRYDILFRQFIAPELEKLCQDITRRGHLCKLSISEYSGPDKEIHQYHGSVHFVPSGIPDNGFNGSILSVWPCSNRVPELVAFKFAIQIDYSIVGGDFPIYPSGRSKQVDYGGHHLEQFEQSGQEVLLNVFSCFIKEVLSHR